MEHQIIIVGIGPGSPDYLVPAGKREIDGAQVLVGSKRALDTFAGPEVQTYVIDKDIDSVIAFITDKLQNCDVVVLVSGDPGFYSFLTALRRRYSADRIRVIPGISSAQMAFARLSEPWQEAGLISMHGRNASEAMLSYQPGKRLGILTDGKHNPAIIAEKLLSAGWPEDTQVWLCSNLSYPEEKIAALRMREVREAAGFEHCVMVVIS